MVAVADKPTAEMRPYGPRGAARDVMLARDYEILIDGPAGTGKSIALLSKVYLCAEKYDGCRILLVRKTRKSMTESVLVTWESKVVPPLHPCLRGASRRVRQAYTFPNGSTVVLGGMDNEHEAAVMSTDYDMILVFEGTELTQNDYEKLLTRLRNGVMPYQQAIVDCNPSHNRHWLKARADSGGMRRLISRHQDNPMLYGDDGELTPEGERYMQILDGLSGARRERLLHGKWVAAEGMVYDDWDEATHLVDPFKIPDEWRRVRVIDFGYTNPFVCQWWALDNDDRAYLYREIYKTRTLVEDHAAQIVKLSGDEEYEATITDHDAEDRATLARHSIETIAASKSIKPGIEAVQARLRIAGDGRPRLFVFRDCLVEIDTMLEAAKKPTCTAHEFDAYVWHRSKEGRAEKETPVKDNDHGMDAMRYMASYIDGIETTPFVVSLIGPEDV